MPSKQMFLRPRVIIIDNYDSYTFNLYQFFTAYNGETPVVIRNNQYSWDEFKDSVLPLFDAVVISPGPGRPDVEEDFGICSQILLECKLPILGVCLGLQGLVTVNGGSVVSAKPPMHGRLSPVFHDGKELFKSIPSPFNVVRYHSLIASPKDLPENLEIIAWSEGITDSEHTIMGLKHKSLPIWTVQFHPESISTEHGQTIVNNFCEMAKLKLSENPCMETDASEQLDKICVIPHGLVSPSAPKLKKLHAYVELSPVFVDAELLFESKFANSDNNFWLDSAKVEQGLSRFSFMGGAEFGPEGYRISYSLKDRKIRTFGAIESEVELLESETFFTHLSQIMHDSMVGSDSIEFVGTDEAVKLPFLGGLVGYVGYEMKAETLKLSKTQHEFQTKYGDDIPDTSFLFADRLICYDHQFSKLYLVTLVNDPNNNAIDKKNQKLWTNTMKQDIQSLSMQVKPFGAFDEVPVKKIPQVKLVHEKKDYIDMIEQSLQKIKEGETYEVCLTTQLKAVLQKPHPSPFEMYKHLRKRNPAPYAAYFSFGKDLVVTSSSPERYLRIDDKNKISMKPIKGTLKTASSSNFNGTLQEIKEENERRRVKLATSEKDQSENLMIVDLIRNDLNQISEPNSVKVPHLMVVESYATVHQLVTTVTSTLKSELSAVDALMRSFPPGSMTGAPKLRTVQIIESLEKIPRGIYSGVVGFFSVAGDADFSVVIRTAVFNQKDEEVTKVSIGAGGAIVSLSDPQDEFEEMVLKAHSVLPSLGHIYNDFFKK